MNPSRIRRLLRVGGTTVTTAICVGLLTGLSARLMMRVVAIAAGLTSHFSWAGTAGIVGAFTVVALPGAALAIVCSGRARWLASGVLPALLCVPATGVAGGELGSASGYSTGKWIVVGAAILGVYACIAAIPVLTVRLASALGAVAARTAPSPPEASAAVG